MVHRARMTSVYSKFVDTSPKGGRRFWCLPPLLLFFCLVVSLFMANSFLLLAHSRPDVTSAVDWALKANYLSTSFSLNLLFSKGVFFVCGSCFSFLERFGDEYFSWWYVQHNYAAIWHWHCLNALILYNILNLWLFLSIQFFCYF